MISGAIQQGVPTKVAQSSVLPTKVSMHVSRTSARITHLAVGSITNPATPKSAIFTFPCLSSKIFPALMSLRDNVRKTINPKLHPLLQLTDVHCLDCASSWGLRGFRACKMPPAPPAEAVNQHLTRHTTNRHSTARSSLAILCKPFHGIEARSCGLW